MGIIMAQAAVLEIHMDRKAVESMKPRRRSLGEAPTKLWVKTLGQNSGSKLWIKTLGQNSGSKFWVKTLESIFLCCRLAASLHTYSHREQSHMRDATRS
jgi:hypothetical protein